jgi:hypothetical protein
MNTSNARFRVTLQVVVLLFGIAFASGAGAADHTTGAASSHVVLPLDTLVSGATERGTLVIVNGTGRPIRWDCPYLEVQLTNAHWPLEVHPTPCPQPARTLAVGTTRLPFSLRAGQTVCEGSCKSFPAGTYHTQEFAGPDVPNPPAITVHVVTRLIKISVGIGEKPRSVQLRVGQSLEVTIDPTKLSWVGDTNLAPSLKADNPCDTTCNEPVRTFTAIATGHATILTVQNCNADKPAPEAALCALGPEINVTVTAS